MTVEDIAKLSKLLARFLIRFADCFARPAGQDLLLVYVQGLLSSVQRKNAEAIALDRNVAPRGGTVFQNHPQLLQARHFSMIRAARPDS